MQQAYLLHFVFIASKHRFTLNEMFIDSLFCSSEFCIKYIHSKA
jgi:hypothetical protein